MCKVGVCYYNARISGRADLGEDINSTLTILCRLNIQRMSSRITPQFNEEVSCFGNGKVPPLYPFQAHLSMWKVAIVEVHCFLIRAANSLVDHPQSDSSPLFSVLLFQLILNHRLDQTMCGQHALLI